MQRVWADIPVIIVSYRTPGDVAACLKSLDAMEAEPSFSVHICENGGGGAFDDLYETLLQPDGPCSAGEDDSADLKGPFNRIRGFRLRASGRKVFAGEASANLGYAGGINAWLLPLLRYEGWPGCWILNPDTLASPGALSELVAHAKNRQLGMAGSRIMLSPTDRIVINMGLRWRRLRGSSCSVGAGAPASVEPNPNAVEAEIVGPSGASLYITRACAEELAPLDERYFLYFEDLDWGMRTRRAGFKAGYAHNSVVIHSGGSSIGSPSRDSVGSPFSIYLQFRSGIQFARIHYPGWLPWTALMGSLDALRLLPKGRFVPAIRGLAAGLRGETGRPEIQLVRDRVSRSAKAATMRSSALRFSKAIISLGWLGGLRAVRLFSGQPDALWVLYYHAMRPEALPMFRWQLSAIEAYGDTVHADYVGPSDGRPKIAITFDDAFQSVFEFALPEMLKRNIPVSVFVPAAYVGGTPSWGMEGVCPDRNEGLASAEILRAAASKGVKFGAHSRTHPRLSTLTADEEHEEIAGSKADLERILGKKVDLFSFPYGDFSARTLRYCKESGYRFAYSIEPAAVDLAQAELLRPRISVDPSDTKLEFWLKIRGAYSWMRYVSRAKRGLRRSVSNLLGQGRRAESAA